MNLPTLAQGETVERRAGRVRRRNRHRHQAASCRDCRWMLTGPATPAQAAQHADQQRHVVDLEYRVGYTYAPPDRVDEARR